MSKYLAKFSKLERAVERARADETAAWALLAQATAGPFKAVQKARSQTDAAYAALKRFRENNMAAYESIPLTTAVKSAQKV